MPSPHQMQQPVHSINRPRTRLKGPTPTSLAISGISASAPAVLEIVVRQIFLLCAHDHAACHIGMHGAVVIVGSGSRCERLSHMPSRSPFGPPPRAL